MDLSEPPVDRGKIPGTAIDRRDFLRLYTFAAASALAPPAQPPRSPSPTEPIVVVGAGLAGLRAADLLRKAGRSVVVLEARGQPGGRVQTIRAPFDNGLYAEAGPIRIPITHQTVLRLAREYRLSVMPFAPSDGASIVTLNGASSRSVESLDPKSVPSDLKPGERGLSQAALLARYVSDLPADIAELAPTAASYAGWRSVDRVSWPEWLRSRGASDGAVKLMTLGGDSRELSALYVLRQFALLRSSSRNYKIRGGMDQLPRAMAASLGSLVKYNAAVVRVNRDQKRLRVDYTENGRTSSIAASRVVLAIPFSTLRQIEIRPRFSRQKELAIAELPYFPATRFLLQSRSRFWRAAGLRGAARTDRPAEIWDCTYDLPGARGILGATAGGALGRAALDMTAEASVQFGVGLVADAFPKIRLEFEKGVSYRWALEPWSRGAFAVFHPGQMTRFMPDIGRPEGRVHFAGEHTSVWMGWMEGALQSGERAAREILNSVEET